MDGGHQFRKIDGRRTVAGEAVEERIGLDPLADVSNVDMQPLASVRQHLFSSGEAFKLNRSGLANGSPSIDKCMKGHIDLRIITFNE